MGDGFPRPFGRYTLQGKLGEGGMGDVYLAHDSLLETQVALKIPKFGSADNSSDVVARFYREARAMARIPHHANICPVRDVGEFNGHHFLVMSFIEGVSLFDVPKPIPIPHAIRLISTIADAMQVAHEHNVIHRDLKPANILITEDRVPVVMDFGLARRDDADDSITTTIGRMVGTPAYMSLEQVEGKREGVGPLSDLYSLGVVLYELLTGVLPFQGSVFTVVGQILSGAAEPVAAHNASIDDELNEICMTAMARLRTDRYPSMTAFSKALGKYYRKHAERFRKDRASRRNWLPVANTPEVSKPVNPDDQLGKEQKTIIGTDGDTAFRESGIAASSQEVDATETQVQEEVQLESDTGVPG